MNILISPELSRTTAYLRFDEQLSELSKQVIHPAHGFFGPGSMSWQVFKQPGLAIGGYRALLLQIAHPAVASGVDRYSNFKRDTYGRAKRTYEAMMQMVFGDMATAMQMARKLFHIHFHIRASYQQLEKGCSTTVQFRASDPELLLWVLATIIDTSLLAYELIYPPLAASQKEQFYQELKTLALLMGIPASFYPADYNGFRKYFADMIEGNILTVDTTAQALADDIVNILLPLRPTARLLASQLLPDKLRHAYGFRTSSFRQHAFMFLLGGMRLSLPRLPSAMWAPPYHQAMYRIARQEGTRPALPARIYHLLGTKFHFPATAKV